MRHFITLCFAFLLFSFGAVSQVKDAAKPFDSGTGCINVVSRLQRLVVGKMRVKTCCDGITLIANVRQENTPTGRKKSIHRWQVVNAAGEELEAEKGVWSSVSPRAENTIIKTTVGNACFIIKKDVLEQP